MLLLSGLATFDFGTIDLKVVLTALGIIIALFIAFYFQWWRNRKRLSYEILSDVILISAKKEIQDKVEIRYEGVSVRNVRVIVVKLINDGYLPIKKDEFDKPVRFVFPKGKILTAEKVRFYPDNLGTQIGYRDDWLQIDPCLLNRKDYIQFKVLLSDYQEMEIDARIIGVSSITRSRKRMNMPDHVLTYSALIGLSLLFLRERIPGTAFFLLALTLLVVTLFLLVLFARRQH